MLGLGRASEYAGWWGGPAKFSSITEVNFDFEGRYLDTISMTPNAWTTPASRSFDNAGLANGAKGTTIMTFRYQAGSNFTWGTDSLRSSYENIKNGAGVGELYTPITQEFDYDTEFFTFSNRLCRTVTGKYLSVFSSFNGYEYATLNGNLVWDDYADRWMTMIVSYSSSSGDFANWTGISGGSDYYQRTVLQDAKTGELLSLTDSRYSGFQGYDTNWANYTWSWAPGQSGSPSTANTRITPGVSGSQFDQTDWLTAACWTCQGAVIDPMATVDSVLLRNYFVGQCFPETVNGARAWFNITFFDETVDGSDTLLTKILESRASQTNDYIFKQSTATLISPSTSADIP